jgi:hypothetical protein
MSETHRMSVRCWGETYSVEQDGPVWRRPDNGARSADPKALLRAMIEDSARAGGDDPEDIEIAGAIARAMRDAR